MTDLPQAEQHQIAMHVVGSTVGNMAAGVFGPTAGYVLPVTVPNPDFETNGGPPTMLHVVSSLQDVDIQAVVESMAAQLQARMGTDGTLLRTHAETLAANVAENEEKLARLTIKRFLETHNVTCAETIYQTDKVIENATGLIEDLADIVGYPKDKDEREDDDEEDDIGTPEAPGSHQ